MIQGKFDNNYKWIEITSKAQPFILLEPQYFANSKYEAIQFISLGRDTNNSITIYPLRRTVQVLFTEGVNSMHGVPKNYSVYNVEFRYPATANEENNNAIIQWKEATELRVVDQGDVSAGLYRRADELSQLKELWLLNLCMNVTTYENIMVAKFINNVVKLRSLSITITSAHMSNNQMREFMLKNKIPSNWNEAISFGFREVYYRKVNHL